MDISFNLNDGEAIAVGVSGGPDSMALCWLLSVQARDHNERIEIHALTVDHGIRQESKDEAVFVKGTVSEWGGLKHTTLPVEEEINAEDTGLMAKARDERYKAMAAYCEKHNIKKLFVAHHEDDQAETVLLRLCKGSGLNGLSGMASTSRYSESLDIIRPLLEVPKSDLVKVCDDNNVPYIEDPTNANLKYSRNNLRHSKEILAEEGLNTRRIVSISKRMSRASEALGFYAETVLAEALISQSGTARETVKGGFVVQGGRDRHIVNIVKKELAEHGNLMLDLQKMQAHPEEIFLRVLIMAIKSFYSDEEYGYGPRLEKLEALSAAMYQAENAFKKRTLGGLIFSIIMDRDENGPRIKIEREN